MAKNGRPLCQNKQTLTSGKWTSEIGRLRPIALALFRVFE